MGAGSWEQGAGSREKGIGIRGKGEGRHKKGELFLTLLAPMGPSPSLTMVILLTWERGRTPRPPPSEAPGEGVINMGCVKCLAGNRFFFKASLKSL